MSKFYLLGKISWLMVLLTVFVEIMVPRAFWKLLKDAKL